MLNAIRQTIRSLRNTPGFSIVVVGTLALGIGATTAIYSVVSHVILRPLPYPDPDRLVNVWTAMPESGIEMLAVAHAEYLDYRAESRLIDEAGAFFSRPMILTGADEPAKITAAWTTVSLLTGLVAGAIPAWRVSRTDLVGVLRSGGEHIASAANRQRMRSVLVIVETAMAVVLVAGAALLLRSLWQLQRVDPGIEPDHVLTAQLSLSPSDYTNAGEVQAFYDGLLDRLSELPGVRSAALVNSLPMRDMIRMILVHGSWLPEEGEPIGADVVMVSASYLETIGNPVIIGRGFTDGDRSGAARVAALNETAAKAFFGESDAIGEQLMILQSVPNDVGFEVVAVVQDVPIFGLGTDVRPQVYLPLPLAVAEIGGVTRAVSVVLKASGDPSSLAGALRSTIWDLDDQLAISNVETMEQVVTASLSPQRFQAVLLGLFSALALVLASVGLYGLLAHIVALRRKELGVRLAMGAVPGRLVRLVVGHAMRLSAVGVALGIVATIAVSRVMEGLLFGIERSDAASLVVTAVVILSSTVIAAWLPARRAATIDPAVMLREE